MSIPSPTHSAGPIDSRKSPLAVQEAGRALEPSIMEIKADLPASRKTSSPLSSPSSYTKGYMLDRDDHLDYQRSDLPENHGEIRSPATSSTLPLTDEEEEDDDDEQIGDDDSELTEEDDEQEQEEDDKNIGKIRQPIFPSSRSNRDSRASSASLTPPPSDQSILSSPQHSPKISLKLNPPHIDEQEDFDESEDEELEGDGDVTMRAGPSEEEVREGNQEVMNEIEVVRSAHDEENDVVENQGADNNKTMQEAVGGSNDDPSNPDEEEEQEEEGVDDNEEDSEENKIVIDDDEVDVAPPVEIEVEVEEPTEEAEDENGIEGETSGERGERGDNEDFEAADSPAYLTVPNHGKHSTHAPPPTTANMRALMMLELKFAALRDRLYIERMEEAAAEEEMILNGTHPALQYLYKTLSDRRERLHEVASRRHQQTLGELKRVRESEKHLIWSSWTDDRDQLHWDEFEQTWSKRRRLAREKNEIETPRIVKPVPKVGQALTIRAFDWSAGATPSQLSREDGNRDLALMNTRRHHQPQAVTRHGSPAMFPLQYNAAGTSTQPANGGATIYSYPQTQHQQSRDPLTHSQPRHTSSSAGLQQQKEVQAQAARPPNVDGQPPNSMNPAYPPRIVKNHQTSQVQAQQTYHQPVQRREGRTVPTTSDFFTGQRRDLPTATQKVKSPEEDQPASPIGLWSRGMNGTLGGGNKKQEVGATGSSPKTSSSLANTPTLPNGSHPSHSVQQQSARPGSAGNANIVKQSPTDGGTNLANNSSSGPIRSNSAENASSKPTSGAGVQLQAARSNSNPTTSTNITSDNATQQMGRNVRDLDRPGNGTSSNPLARERPDFPSRFASLADYLASSTAPPGTGLFGMGLGMGMGMGMGGMGIGVPLGVGNKGRSPYQNGNGTSASTSNANSTMNTNNRDVSSISTKSNSPIPPPPPAGPVTTAGTTDSRK
uniref:Uncharacterized protein n=1 Tax=Kwoniella pini CBS 10737 TaxID=1296096 RepID=A0A1B9HZ36_9TREE|nr:uncharacterized protein I206_05299 [Kwoniella pini CBS 10737]OCF48520.1 hypothetical protein I206_05299 [Kwoniella pini CBS 10737]